MALLIVLFGPAARPPQRPAATPIEKGNEGNLDRKPGNSASLGGVRRGPVLHRFAIRVLVREEVASALRDGVVRARRRIGRPRRSCCPQWEARASWPAWIGPENASAALAEWTSLSFPENRVYRKSRRRLRGTM